MTTMRLMLERVEDGIVRVRVVDEDVQAPAESLIWECTVAQDYTRKAQKAALKATLDYLNTFIDLSQGGRY